MREALQQYIKRVQELAEHVRGNEQATKQILVGPLFTILGYDLTDPRECTPEYRVDFGPSRSVKPIDWAFFQTGRPIFFVEAKEVGKKLDSYDEQLADYFAKAPEARLGIQDSFAGALHLGDVPALPGPKTTKRLGAVAFRPGSNAGVGVGLEYSAGRMDMHHAQLEWGNRESGGPPASGVGYAESDPIPEARELRQRVRRKRCVRRNRSSKTFSSSVVKWTTLKLSGGD